MAMDDDAVQIEWENAAAIGRFMSGFPGQWVHDAEGIEIRLGRKWLAIQSGCWLVKNGEWFLTYSDEMYRARRSA